MYDRTPEPKLRTTFDDLISPAKGKDLEQSISEMEIETDFMA